MEYVQARLEQLGFDDIRPAHMAIFQNLGPGGARIGELAERAKLTNQSVGYLVDYLEEHGYVERRPDPTNRRATLVCFTERGWDEADACAKILDQLDDELTQRMGAERLEQLQALLAEATAALLAGKLAIQALRGRPRSRHQAASDQARQPAAAVIADQFRPTRHRDDDADAHLGLLQPGLQGGQHHLLVVHDGKANVGGIYRRAGGCSPAWKRRSGDG